MPEGHVTHRWAAALTEAFAGTVTHSSSPQGRFAASAAVIDGRVLDEAESVGKHVFCHVGADIVHVHLGMAGRTTLHRDDAPTTDIDEQVTTRPAAGEDRQATRPVVGAVRWRLENDDAWCDLRGPAICELITDRDRAAIVARLGPDPLRGDADPGRAWARVHASTQPIAALLMDQRTFAGVGNIFRAEALYRAGLDPMLPGVALRRAEFDALWADLVEVMRYALAHGRIDTVRPEHTPEAMGRDPRVDRHGGEVYVYRREHLPCLVCGTPVRRVELAARNLFWCPGCQPRSRRAAAVAARRAAKRVSARP